MTQASNFMRAAFRLAIVKFLPQTSALAPDVCKPAQTVLLARLMRQVAGAHSIGRCRPFALPSQMARRLPVSAAARPLQRASLRFVYGSTGC